MQTGFIDRGIRVDWIAHRFAELGDEDLLGLIDGVCAARKNKDANK
jgi:hypothetical protein